MTKEDLAIKVGLSRTVVKPGDTVFRVPPYPPEELPCSHPNGWRHEFEGEEWYSMSLQEVQEGVDAVFCDLCGEMWFCNEEGHENGPGWHQRYWTAEEVAQVEENAKKYDAFFDLPDD